MTCTYCNQPLKGTNQKKFCSRSCAATYNNKVFRKRKAKLRKCRTCDAMIGGVKHGQRLHCFDCIKNCKHIKGKPMKTQTIEEIVKRAGSNRYDGIRTNARAIYKKELDNPCCEKCGYTKHVELCHKRAISEFEKTTLVVEVNKRDNIMFLCPNCHWEFDHEL
jgi:hypothetical protein